MPLNLDNHIFSRENSKASILKSRLVADFTDWKNNEEKMIDTIAKIVNALKLDRKKIFQNLNCKKNNVQYCM